MNKALCLAFLSIFALAACEEKQVAPPEIESRPAKLLTVVIGEQGLNRVFPGTVQADDKAVLAFRVSGQLVDIPVKAGQEVQKNQELAELDKDDYGLMLAKARAVHELALVQFDRATRLRKDRVISEQDFDKASSALSEAKAQLEQAQANYNYTTLKAPYSGTISLRLKEENEYVGAQTPVMHIQSNDIINVSFQLPERYFSYFTGTRNEVMPQVEFDAYKGTKYISEFKEMDTEADAKTGSYRVTVSLPRPQQVNVLPGMAATVYVDIPSAQQSVVPNTAFVKQANGQIGVWKVGENGEVDLTDVTVEDGKITAGLNSGDVIVETGIGSLKPGDKVYPWVKERGL